MKVVWKIIFADEYREITWHSSPKKPIEIDEDVLEFLEKYRLSYFRNGFEYNNSQAVEGKEVYEMGTAFNLFLGNVDRRWKKFRASEDYDGGFNPFEIISKTPKDPHFPEVKGQDKSVLY